ncbi:hypothetical protein E1301_Tti016351 [Triplophysa tibetana]|uniref:Uncharacterized protein n=1 Tax=Triplophysa tibetana TaxID=1572043 RepID=A0A5A9NEG7_9TELE|nr:hypothetical protein E1301_Tti016351 [Triplophysa tibetana]
MCSICDVYGKILPEIAERVPSAPLMNDDDNDLWQRRCLFGVLCRTALISISESGSCFHLWMSTLAKGEIWMEVDPEPSYILPPVNSAVIPPALILHVRPQQRVLTNLSHSTSVTGCWKIGGVRQQKSARNKATCVRLSKTGD